MTDLIHGWEEEKIEKEWEGLSPGLLAQVKQELLLRYPGYTTELKNKRALNGVDAIAEYLVKRRQTGKVPWVVVVSESPSFLHTCAQAVPPILALTLRMKPATITSDKMIRLVLEPKNEDFAIRTIQDDFRAIKQKGVLAWSDFLGAQGFNKMTSSISDLFAYRMSKRLCTLLLCAQRESGNQKIDMDRLLGAIEKTYGTSVTLMLKELALFQRLVWDKVNPAYGKDIL